MDGYFLIDKPEGYTSRQVCDEIGRLFGTKKVGHSGTLDPFATGLLLVSLNKATKTIAFMDDFAKRYVATIKLGEETDTLDNTGEVVKTAPVGKYTREEILKVLKSFLGASKQVPPMTSAIHINGQKLYKLAHKGKEIDRPARDIFIEDIDLIAFTEDTITFEARVSKGTYIRVLGKDIAEKLGTCGYLISLRRTEVGPFPVEDAVPLKKVKEIYLYSVYEILKEFCDVIEYDDEDVLDVKNGKIQSFLCDSEFDKLLIVDSCNSPIAVYTREKDDEFVFRRGLF